MIIQKKQPVATNERLIIPCPTGADAKQKDKDIYFKYVKQTA